MSKKSLKKEDRKVKFTISLDPILYDKLNKAHSNKSKFIESIISKSLDK